MEPLLAFLEGHDAADESKPITPPNGEDVMNGLARLIRALERHHSGLDWLLRDPRLLAAVEEAANRESLNFEELMAEVRKTIIEAEPRFFLLRVVDSFEDAQVD
jgi:hypothetical protein